MTNSPKKALQYALLDCAAQIHLAEGSMFASLLLFLFGGVVATGHALSLNVGFSQSVTKVLLHRHRPLKIEIISFKYD